MAYGPVKLRQNQIGALRKLYKDTYLKLVKEILTATEAGKIHRLRVMARINVELEKLGVDVEKWIRKEIPQYYLDGRNQAIEQLRNQGIAIKPAAVNRQAIDALVSETSLAFAEGIRGMSRNARTIINTAFRQQLNMEIAMGRLEGETLRTIAAGVRQTLRDSGLGAIVDKGGRQWEFGRYAEMLVRTKAVEARNEGLANTMLQHGYDLVEVSDHNSSHKECARWEGKILSLSGQTPGYPRLETAKNSGLFHPNCQHSINVVSPSLAAKTKAYDNPYNYLRNRTR